METHIKKPNLNHVINAICPRWSFASNHSADPNGRVIVMWKSPLLVNVLQKTKQTITCKVTYPGDNPFYYTVVYAANTSKERNYLWIDLLTLQAMLLNDTWPWIVGGDFNETLHPSEHSRHYANSITADMRDFKACLDQLEIKDLHSQGLLFTWTNKQPDDPKAKKLDRVLINENWITSYPLSIAKFLAPKISDHTPACVTFASPLPLAGTRPFKFLNFLSGHPDFLPLMVSNRLPTPIEQYSLLSLITK